MANYQIRYVITKTNRIFKLDGWMPVREIIKRHWTNPDIVTQDEILGGKIITIEEVNKYVDEPDSNISHPSVSIEEAIFTSLSQITFNIYKYYVNCLSDTKNTAFKSNFVLNKDKEEYIFLSASAIVFFIFDNALGNIYPSFKEQKLSNIYLENQAPSFFNKIFPSSNKSYDQVVDSLFKYYEDYCYIFDFNNYHKFDMLYYPNKSETQKEKPVYQNAWEYLNRCFFLLYSGFEIDNIPKPDNHKIYLNSFEYMANYLPVYVESISLFNSIFESLKLINNKIK